jgi:transposase
MRSRAGKVQEDPEQNGKEVWTMEAQKRYSQFCGIDMGKRKHVACIIDQDGSYLLRPRSFINDITGYQRILNYLGKTGKTSDILVGMEASGHYWYSLHDFLTKKGYELIVLNPIQTSMQAKKGIRKCKTDKHDAYHIATLLKNGGYRASIVPGELGMTCRQLTRLRFNIVRQGARIKQLIRSRLHPIWPEYEKVFVDIFCSTSMKLLYTAPTPEDLLMLDHEELHELLRKASRGKYGKDRTKRVLEAANNSIGMKRGISGMRISIRTLLDQLQSLKPIRQKLEEDIYIIADELPGYLLTLPGINRLSAVGLYGEVDPIESFKTPSQLVAFAGLDPIVFQTGQYNAPRRRISKRGSPYLRYTIWNMAFRAVYQEGDLRTFWLRKRGKGMKHLDSVTAAAIKLCHIIWRIMSDRRDYIVEGYNPNS